MFEFCLEEENGRKLGNGKRGCVAYIYTLSNDPTPFPAIPPGVGGSKDSPSVLAYISTSQGSYCPARAAPPAAQQPIAFIPQLSTAGIHQLQLSLKCSYSTDCTYKLPTFQRKRTQQKYYFVAFTISRPSSPVDHPHQTGY